ncbi:MAG TPA: PTS sugar transporter subunit IIC [Nitrospirota bacterium]|nr:PTS sugar transporter subunit IIC [Nitrospirota bacterium]
MPVFDLHMIAAIVVISIVGGLLGLDRTAVGQFMVSQPLVAGPCTGWMLGDATAGLIIGIVLEMIWLLDMPIGNFVPADATVVTVSACAIAILGKPGGDTLSVISFSLLLTTVMVPLTMQADAFIRKRNSKLMENLLSSNAENMAQAIARAHLSGISAFFLKSFVLCLVIIPAGIAAVLLFEHLPGTAHHALSLFIKLLPLIGAALIARKLSIKSFDLFLISGFVIAAVFGFLFHVPVLIVLLLTVIAGWLGARYSEQRS